MKWILVSIIALIFIGGIAAGVFFILKSDKNGESINFLIKLAAQEKTGKIIQTDFEIRVPENGFSRVVYEGKTLENSFILLNLTNVNLNETIYIFNKNNPYYYSSNSIIPAIIERGTGVFEFVSIIDLEPVGSVEVSHEGKLEEKGQINLTLKNNGEFRNPAFCLIWSVNLLNVNMPLDSIEKPKRLEFADKCFSDFNSFLSENGKINRTYQINYESINPPEDFDYLKIYVIDGDRIPERHYLNSAQRDTISFEGNTGEDIGAEDILYEIN